jgi:hypothetical protein
MTPQTTANLLLCPIWCQGKLLIEYLETVNNLRNYNMLLRIKLPVTSWLQCSHHPIMFPLGCFALWHKPSLFHFILQYARELLKLQALRASVDVGGMFLQYTAQASYFWKLQQIEVIKLGSLLIG